MMNYTLAVAFSSILGDVETKDIFGSLSLMGRGMLGILIVMLLIYAVIAILNKVTKNKDQD